MRTSPDAPRLKNEDNLTLDELLEFCDTESSQEDSLYENKKPDKPKTKFEKLIEDVENRLSKVNEAVLSKSFFEYVLTPDGITSFSNHLISHLKNIDPNEENVLLHFLQTAICYSSKFAEGIGCNLDGILSAAILLLRNTNEDPIDDTFFDYIIKYELEECSDNSLLDLKSYYEQFCEVRNENSQKIILKHLIKIAKNYNPYRTI